MTFKPVFLASLAVALACTTLQAHALGQLADVTLIDRDSGATLAVHYYRGDYWVAGRPGARYAVTVRNKTGERLLAVPAVDGVNVLSGETAGWGQSGYVFGPHQGYQITGWRKSNSEVAAFEFSNAGDSYAGLTGRPGSVGVIGVALFREQLPEPVASAPQGFDNPVLESYGKSSPSRQAAPPSARSESDLPAQSPPAAAQSGALSNKAEATPSLRDQAQARSAPQPTPKLGTAHGQREASRVLHTSFERLQSQPNEVIRIRYDSRENLIASGVIRERVALPLPAPNPFPQSANTSYVPDPPLRRY